MDATISWLEWFGAARAPSDFDIDINSTTNWKVSSLKEFNSTKVLCPFATIWNTLHKLFSSRTHTSIKVTIYCRIDAFAPSEANISINLKESLRMVAGVT